MLEDTDRTAAGRYLDLVNAEAAAKRQIFISSLKINAVRHLKDVEIVVSDDGKMRHLILTGPNGSGKTSVLQALFRHLKLLVEDRQLQHLDIRNNIGMCQKGRDDAHARGDERQVRGLANALTSWEKQAASWWGEVEPVIANEKAVAEDFANRQFIVAYYADDRHEKFIAPQTPTRPKLEFAIAESKVKDFLQFLVHLKIQQALAKNEGQNKDADAIERWFADFERILQSIFSDSTLRLAFDYKTYNFEMETEGKRVSFTALSAGYSAALDIVADLILKMQTSNQLTRGFDMRGIVLIDEIETHLHLSLQKIILQILTRVFPNIQFIISSHSPFVINSVSNVTVFDLKSRERIEDLTEYSYEALAEGVFGVDLASGELKRRLDRMEELAAREALSDVERAELSRMADDFASIPNALAPAQKLRYEMLCVELRTKGFLE